MTRVASIGWLGYYYCRSFVFAWPAGRGLITLARRVPSDVDATIVTSLSAG